MGDRDGFLASRDGARAEAVLDYFQSNYADINTAQYQALGKGADTPIAENGTVEGRQANRRVEFKVLNPEDLKKEIIAFANADGGSILIGVEDAHSVQKGR